MTMVQNEGGSKPSKGWSGRVFRLARGIGAWLISPELRWRLLVLLAILAGLMYLKGQFDPGLGRPGLDGSFYYQIARNVAEGNGLTTNVSLYNQGLTSFPHPTNYAPAWPITLGLVGKIFDLETAAHILPELFYLASLLLLYSLVNTLVRRAGDRAGRRWHLGGRFVDIGHVAVLLLGTNRVFFEFTSMPYTEGMAFTMMLAALVSADAAARRRSLWLAGLAGAFACIAFMSRTQMIGIAVTLPAVLGILGFKDRRFFLMALVAGAAEMVFYLPWAFWVASWHPSLSLSAITGMGTIRETSGLNFAQSIKTEGIDKTWNVVKQGLEVAFSTDRRNSYFFSFGWGIFIVPLALLQFVIHWSDIKGVFGRLFKERNVLPVMMVLAAVLMLVPIHMEKRKFFKAWLFGWRHGLPFMLLISVSLGFLLIRRERITKVITALLIAGALMCGYDNIEILFNKRYSPGLDGPEVPLVEWLDSQDPRPKVITAHAQILATESRSYFHWNDCKTNWKHVEALFEKAGADYLLVYPRHKRCGYFKQLNKRKKIERIKTFKRGWKIEVWGPSREGEPPDAAEGVTSRGKE